MPPDMTACPPLQPGLMVLQGNRLELLRDAVFQWLESTPLGPLEEEVFLVQSNGTAEWLKAQWAQRSGICAAVRTELPARFVWRSYRAVLGAAGAPAQSPLDKSPLRWRLLRQLPEAVQGAGFEALAGYLAAGGVERRLQLAGALADVFDQYQVYRADWLRAWAQGQEVLLDARGQATPLPEAQRWQARLWRQLAGAVPQGGQDAARPEVHARFIAELRSGAKPGKIARRVVVFGMSHLPLQTLEALIALAAHVQVMIAAPNPCQYHWADLIDGREWFASIVRRQRLRGDNDPASLPLHAVQPQAHPLLAAWGRQGRDFMRLLDEHEAVLNRIDVFDPTPPQTLLQQVQAAVRDLLPLTEHPFTLGEPPPAEDDRSIVFHVAHSAQREVEVLHEQLLHLLAHPPSSDPQLASLAPPEGDGSAWGGPAPTRQPLAPREIVVMVPDLKPFEAAIRAVFDQYATSDARHIPYAIADLGPRGREPLLLILEWLLKAPEPRCTASELRELLALPALARRFGLTAEDLPRIEGWLLGSGLRWGLDAAHRATLGLAEAGAWNTWQFAIDRMLLGYASGEAQAFDGIEPYAEVGGLEAALAGSLAELFQHLQAWWRDASQPRRPVDWAERLRALLADLFDARDERERGVLAALDDALRQWLDDCQRADFDAPVPLAVARTAWLDALDAPSLTQRFTAGGVTFCTLMPMRAIPFEVVCLLGMNEGDYPRRMPRMDFDLMNEPGQRRPGDRAARDDDRYLLLEAVLSARRLLYVSWCGRSVRDNSPQPPSVLVGELRDYLDAGFDEGLSARLTTEHPLQPFSRCYFEPGAAERGWITYAREWLAAHEAPAATAEPTALPFDVQPLLPLTVARLANFLKNPARHHYRERLGVRFDEIDPGLADEESFGLGALQETQAIDHLLTVAQQSTAPLEHAAHRLQGEGALPLGAAGDWARDQLLAAATPMHEAWLTWRDDCRHDASALPLRFAHGDLVLDDWLDGLRAGSAGLVHAHLRASRLLQKDGKSLRAHKLVDTWVLALVAAASGHQLTGRLIGSDACVPWTLPDAATAQAHLHDLIEFWFTGLQQPLPVACKTALAYLAKGDLDAAALVYDGSQTPGEGSEPCLARSWPDFDALSADGQFEDLAQRLYGPMNAWAAGLSPRAYE